MYNYLPKDLFSTFLAELVAELQEIPMDPTQRFYWGSLLSSLVAAWIILHLALGPKGAWSALRLKLFHSKILLHPSSVLDLKIFLFNLLFKSLFLAPILGSAFGLSVLSLNFLRTMAPDFEGLIHLNQLTASIVYTLLFFVISDFFRFGHHYLMHNITFLRNFHRLHHSAEVLTPLTLFRAHPVEVFLAQLRNVLITSLSLTLSVFLFPENLKAIDILGVNLFGMLFNLLGSNLRHSSIALSFGWLEYLFISPRMHQIHHSQDKLHFTKNLGVSLSLWDQLAGTFYRPLYNEEWNLVYGIKNAELLESRNLKKSLLFPFKQIFKN